MNINGMRRAAIELGAGRDNNMYLLQEDFVVSNVSNILISLGRLMKAGWQLRTVEGPQEDGLAGHLVSPDQVEQAPVYRKRNSQDIWLS